MHKQAMPSPIYVHIDFMYMLARADEKHASLWSLSSEQWKRAANDMLFVVIVLKQWATKVKLSKFLGAISNYSCS